MGDPKKEKVPPPGSHAKTPKYNIMYVWGSYFKIVPPGFVRGGVEPGESVACGRAISEIAGGSFLHFSSSFVRSAALRGSVAPPPSFLRSFAAL